MSDLDTISTIPAPAPVPADFEETPWWFHCDKIAAVYRYLAENDLIDIRDIESVAYFLSKPWKFNEERAAMLAYRQGGDHV